MISEERDGEGKEGTERGREGEREVATRCVGERTCSSSTTQSPIASI